MIVTCTTFAEHCEVKLSSDPRYISVHLRPDVMMLLRCDEARTLIDQMQTILAAHPGPDSFPLTDPDPTPAAD